MSWFPRILESFLIILDFFLYHDELRDLIHMSCFSIHCSYMNFQK